MKQGLQSSGKELKRINRSWRKHQISAEEHRSNPGRKQRLEEDIQPGYATHFRQVQADVKCDKRTPGHELKSGKL